VGRHGSYTSLVVWVVLCELAWRRCLIWVRLSAALGSTRRAQQPRDESRISGHNFTGTDHQVNLTAARVWDVHDKWPVRPARGAATPLW